LSEQPKDQSGAAVLSSQSHSVETPSGKGAGDENFPVGSFLLPKHLRPHVMKYYDFARAIDDVADNPGLSSEEKISRLRGFEAVLDGKKDNSAGFEKAAMLRVSMLEMGVPIRHGTDLITAFVQDAVQNRYDDWDGVIGYCENSANPVGRYLLDLHGEDSSGYIYSDALCSVLQILNHLQDCGEDLHEMDRCYIPASYLKDADSSVEEVRASSLSPNLRVVIDRMLDQCALLMEEARQLPSALSNRHLAMESAVIVRLADKLLKRLRKGDPLASRVALTKIDFVTAGAMGTLSGFFSAGSMKRKGVARSKEVVETHTSSNNGDLR